MKFTTQLIFLLATVFALGLALGVVCIKSMATTENFADQTYCYKCGQDKDCSCDNKSSRKSGNKSEDDDDSDDNDSGSGSIGQMQMLQKMLAQNMSQQGPTGQQGPSGQQQPPIQIIAPPPAKQSCPPFPDMSKYILKATVPSCPPLPDLSKYMLKTECPPFPDMSKYVLKSSVPSCPPCIASCNKPCKIGECPPCPRPRCPVVKCPEPKACAPCPTVVPERCPEPNVQCKSNYQDLNPPRPMLASTSSWGF